MGILKRNLSRLVVKWWAVSAGRRKRNFRTNVYIAAKIAVPRE